MVEKPNVSEAPSNVAILGRYILTPDIFEILEKQAPGKGGEIQLTDAIEYMLKSHHIYAYEFIGNRYDVGDKLGFIKATIDFALKREELRDDLLEILKNKLN
jgi:UTP--glucose-1-phosphate uridylyltransferase